MNMIDSKNLERAPSGKTVADFSDAARTIIVLPKLPSTRAFVAASRLNDLGQLLVTLQAKLDRLDSTIHTLTAPPAPGSRAFPKPIEGCSNDLFERLNQERALTTKALADFKEAARFLVEPLSEKLWYYLRFIDIAEAHPQGAPEATESQAAFQQEQLDLANQHIETRGEQIQQLIDSYGWALRGL